MLASAPEIRGLPLARKRRLPLGTSGCSITDREAKKAEFLKAGKDHRGKKVTSKQEAGIAAYLYAEEEVHNRIKASGMYLEIYAELVKLVFDRGMTLEPPRNPDGTVKRVADGILGGPHTLDGLLDIAEPAGVTCRHVPLTVGNGNGRTARLIELQILLAAGVPKPAAQLLSNHYNHTRSEYYRQLDRASKSGGEIIPFIQYAAQGLVEGLREQLEVIRQQQWDVTWRSYVHTRFRDPTGPSAQRQRDLVLDLSASQEPVPIRKIPELSPRLAKAYATKSSKTLARDLAELELVLELIKRTPKGILANREIILAFLPWRKAAPPKEQ